MKLLAFLRDELGLKGTKDGCSEGACGACSVIINGKLTKACIPYISKLEGASVITIEGLTEKEKSIYSYSFAECGAVQCGFCTPGMVMAAKALIDINPEPSRDDVRKAIRGNICRCTGYIKIEDAILMAAEFLRSGTVPEEGSEEGRIRQRFRRVDAAEKALGEGRFADDIEIEGMVYASAIRSPYPRCIVRKIDSSEAEKDERCVAVIKAGQVPERMLGHLVHDWPVLVGEGETTSYIGDALCLVVSYDRNALEELKAKVRIECEELEGVFSIESALEDRIHVHGDTNILVEHRIRRGDADKALEGARYIVSDTFHTPHTEHAFMEPECAIALPEGDGVMLITGGQSIYDEQREVSRMLCLERSKVHVRSALVGGGFGGKEDMSVQHHAALCAYILKRPVKVKLSRQESLIVHPKRHPMDMTMTLGCDGNGRLVGMKCQIHSDTGAYASLGGPVLQRACTHAPGPYSYTNIDIDGIALYTNNVPSGAFRGFGVTQSCFALEVLIDRLASKAGIDPYEFRRINVIKPGDVLPNGQIASPDTGAAECLEAVKSAYYGHGVTGIAMAMKNSGVGVGVPDTGRCCISVESGKLHIRTSAACMGQGIKTVALQIAIETTGLGSDSFIVEEPDTARTPDSGTSTASRQTAFTGEAVRIAASKLRADLDSYGLSELEGKEYSGEFSYVTDPITSEKKNPVSHLAYSYSAQVAELGEDGKVRRITAACDAGTVINRQSIEGQIEGGVLMGMGYALTESFRMENGFVKSKYGTLGLIRATDRPEIDTITVTGKGRLETSYGAKGVGELCTIPTAPAIANAYSRFDGKERSSLPLEDTAYKKGRR